MDIQYVDRKTNKIEYEKIYGRWALALLYGNSYSSRVFSLFFLPFLARIPWVSRLYGFFQKQKKSALKIAPFISAYQIDTSEFLETEFDSFNDFFIRKLKPESRPIVSDSSIAALPADGRYLVFPNLSQTDGFYIKGQRFDLDAFLQNSPLAKRLAEGSMVIARLCPTDYHRFHFPSDGTPSSAHLIDGSLFSVNSLALRKKLSILAENKRMITEIETEEFGTVFYIEIGATCVGTIHQTYTPDQRVKKGDEKGYFSFGGSCIVLLFEKGKIVFDEDLIRNSKMGLETKANFGESMGKKGDSFLS